MKIRVDSLPNELFEDVICIYHLLNDGDVVYVGQTFNLANRIYQHINEEKKIFDEISTFECEKSKLNDLEAEDIVTYKPIYNKTIPKSKKYILLGEIRKEMPEIYEIAKIHLKPVWSSVNTSRYDRVTETKVFIRTEVEEFKEKVVDFVMSIKK